MGRGQAGVRGTFLTHYIFPAFTEGVVMKKNGEVVKALLNYNTLTDEFVFEQNGTHLALDRIEEVRWVVVNQRTFIPVENEFYEVVTHTPVSLCVQFESDIIPPGNETGFGKSQTTAIVSVNDLKRQGRAYALELPSDFTITTKKIHWLNDGGRFKLVKNVQDVKNVFINKAKEIDAYVKRTKVNFRNTDDLVRLVEYCHKPQ